MSIDIKLTDYKDFEGVMTQLAIDRGWEFKFADEIIPVENIFNEATYAPALLTLVKSEFEFRQINLNLDFLLRGESNSLFGAKVQFTETDNAFQAQLWRILGSTMMIEALPKFGPYISLDPLQYALGDTFASYITEIPTQEAN